MQKLPKSLRHWSCDDFAEVLSRELLSLPGGSLPLHLCITQGSHVDESGLGFSLLRTSESEHCVHARVEVFFTEIVANCACGDEPVYQSAYGVLQVNIDKASALATFVVADD